jgi:hypothetical protein
MRRYGQPVTRWGINSVLIYNLILQGIAIKTPFIDGWRSDTIQCRLSAFGSFFLAMGEVRGER